MGGRWWACEYIVRGELKYWGEGGESRSKIIIVWMYGVVFIEKG